MTRLILTFLLSCSLPIQAAYYEALDGVVVDKATDKPMAGAYVMAKWLHYGNDLVGSRTTCVGMFVTRTDEAGAYHIPAPPMPLGKPLPLRIERHVVAYVPRYTMARRFHETKIILEPFQGDGDARALDFGSYASMNGCTWTVEDIAALRPIYEQLDAELATMTFKKKYIYRANRYVQGLDDLESALRAKAKDSPGAK